MKLYQTISDGLHVDSLHIAMGAVLSSCKNSDTDVYSDRKLSDFGSADDVFPPNGNGRKL